MSQIEDASYKGAPNVTTMAPSPNTVARHLREAGRAAVATKAAPVTMSEALVRLGDALDAHNLPLANYWLGRAKSLDRLQQDAKAARPAYGTRFAIGRKGYQVIAPPSAEGGLVGQVAEDVTADGEPLVWARRMNGGEVASWPLSEWSARRGSCIGDRRAHVAGDEEVTA